MSEINDQDLAWPVRDKVTAVQQDAWDRLGRPGTWLTGAERVAIAAEARNAGDCKLCRDRLGALSPGAVTGEHDHLGAVSESEVEQIHHICTDPGRLSRAWFKGLGDCGMAEERYVETVGVIATIFAVDTFTKEGWGSRPGYCPRRSPARPRWRGPRRRGVRWPGSRPSRPRMPSARRTKICMRTGRGSPISYRP